MCIASITSFIERGRNGFSTDEALSLQYSLALQISKMLSVLMENMENYPLEMNDFIQPLVANDIPDEEDERYALWMNILSQMKEAFDAEVALTEEPWFDENIPNDEIVLIVNDLLEKRRIGFELFIEFYHLLFSY
jgi:hypothetical protein